MDLTTVMSELELNFIAISKNLRPTALILLVSLLTIEILWSLVKRKPEDEPMNIVFWKLVTYFWLFFAIQNYQEITKQINDTFLQFVDIALGGTVQAVGPSAIIEDGLSQLQKIWDLVKGFSPKTYLNIIIWAFGAIVLVFMALMIFLAYLEYYLLVNLAIILIPFKMLKFTSFMGDKVFNLIISQNIKIMIVTLIGKFVLQTMTKPLVGTGILINGAKEVTPTNAISYVAVLAGMMFLLTKASSMANSFTSGSASDNDVVGLAVLGAAGSKASSMAQQVKQDVGKVIGEMKSGGDGGEKMKNASKGKK
jgi:P-type conjugative transfer protein TrbL